MSSNVEHICDMKFKVVYFVLREKIEESLLMHYYTECENHRNHVALSEILT